MSDKIFELINEMYKRQKEFERNFVNYDTLTLKTKQLHTKEFSLLLLTEVAELINTINYRSHKTDKEVIVSNVKDEIIDILKYLLAICTIWDFKPQELFYEFQRKTDVVEHKYYRDKKLKLLKDDKVIAVDLDGVLVDYPKCWLDFLNEKLKTSYYDLEIAKNKIPLKIYEQLKHTYRSSGHKRYLPCMSDAILFIDTLKHSGHKIIILTSRPYKKYSRMYADTIYWLRKNNIKYDAIIFDPEKHFRVVNDFPNLKFMVEDNRSLSNKISRAGYKVYLLSNKYNRGKVYSNVIRINNLTDILSKEGMS